MSKIQKRNAAGQYYVGTRLEVAKTKSADDFPEYKASTEVHKLLTDLIEVNAKGFRGVVVTALTGMHLDEGYDPLNNFYGCNPRSIFEGGIWYALQKNDIPCGKSDPLNVAKNANQLNEEWARGRRPQPAAMAVVNFLRMVVNANKRERARLIDYFFYRLSAYAKEISEFKLADIDTMPVARQALASVLVDFTLKYPEAGEMPLFLVCQLLKCVFSASTIQVCGCGESVFSTNTTSRKPADVWLEVSGVEIDLYEVTVKKVTKKRLDDNMDALRSTGHLGKAVTFICRLPEDVSELEVEGGSCVHRGKYYDFVDYRSFCTTLFALLSDLQLQSVVESVAKAVQDKQISMRTKAGWNNIFGQEA